MNVPRRYRIEASYPELPDTQTIVVRPLDDAVPEFQPGQFAMISTFGNAEVPISVSRIGDGELHHTIRGVGAASRSLAGVRVGETIGLRGPFGTSWPLEAADGKDLLILAGGLGLAPLRPVIDHAVANRDRYSDVALLYGTREPAQLLYPQEHIAWGQSLQLLRIVDHATAPWHGPVGMITNLIAKANFGPLDTVAFICGPEVMMRFCARELERVGVPRHQLFLSLERNMKCAVGFCGHCQFAGHFICRDGPVLGYDRIARELWVRDL